MVRRLREIGYITSPTVLSAMEKVPRHIFVPENMREYAYQDTPLHIGEGQTISAPHMVGMMLEILDLQPGQKVLEIGAGSGYHASLMGELVRPGGRICTVERIEALAERARKNIEQAGYSDIIEVITADGTKGLPESAPYDRIIVTAASPGIPQPLKDQLIDGGRLLIPVGGRMYQDLILVVKHGGQYEERMMGEVVFVPLIGQYGYSEGSETPSSKR